MTVKVKTRAAFGIGSSGGVASYRLPVCRPRLVFDAGERATILDTPETFDER